MKKIIYRTLIAILAGMPIVYTAPIPEPDALEQSGTAAITIDATKVEGQISPILYGQFAEYMCDNRRRGLHAEVNRNRSFEESPNDSGLSRYCERYPDDRNDDYGLAFQWDEQLAYPNTKKDEGIING